MGFEIHEKQLDQLLNLWSRDYDIYAQKRFAGGGGFSDTDCIRYGKVKSAREIAFTEKSEYSFKEILMPISQTLFYFNEDTVKEAHTPKKAAIVFMRSCDIHALKRLDEIYLHNGPEDCFYARLRKKIKVVLIGCSTACANSFCVSMGTNRSTIYDLSIDIQDDGYLLDCREPSWNEMLVQLGGKEQDVTPAYVTENKVTVKIPENLDMLVNNSSIWSEYDSRCINCGRCNFVCPTCTCFTMQDLFYSENKKSGERRRIWASCMVDGFTDVALGGCYRKKNGQRMRFKVLHKVKDYKERFGYHMCVGCGRCDDVCPEYISFSDCVNKLDKDMKEVNENGKK